jgi:hypothetical protein
MDKPTTLFVGLDVHKDSISVVHVVDDRSAEMKADRIDPCGDGVVEGWQLSVSASTGHDRPGEPNRRATR